MCTPSLGSKHVTHTLFPHVDLSSTINFNHINSFSHFINMSTKHSISSTTTHTLGKPFNLTACELEQKEVFSVYLTV